MSFEKYKLTKKMLILTPLFLATSIFLAGGGHGYFEPMFALFPYATFTCIWMSELTLINLILAICQFPFYGILIDKASNKRKTSLVILIIHLLVSILILKFANENWK